MGKKRSNRSSASSRGGAASSSAAAPSNAAAGGSGGSTTAATTTVAGTFRESSFAHPLGVPLSTLDQRGDVDARVGGGGGHGGGGGGGSGGSSHGGSSHGSGGGGGQPQTSASRHTQAADAYPFTPAMIRELLAANPGGYGRYASGTATASDLNRLTSMANASANAPGGAGVGGGGGGGRAPTGAVSAGSFTVAGGTSAANVSFGGGGYAGAGSIPAPQTMMSAEDALGMQRYLQSIGQALASQLTATTPDGARDAAGADDVSATFGPVPPPSTSSSAGGGGYANLPSPAQAQASIETLGAQLEALAALVARSPGEWGSTGGVDASGVDGGGGGGSGGVDPPPPLPPSGLAALDALEKMGQATVDHVQSFQRLLGAVAAGTAGNGGTPASSATARDGRADGTTSASSAGASTSSSPARRGARDARRDPSADPPPQVQLPKDAASTFLPVFGELVGLTNAIVAAQEAGDGAKVDEATNRLCERVMRDGRAMGVLSVAMNDPVGAAGMNAVFRGMMGELQGGGGAGGGSVGGSTKRPDPPEKGNAGQRQPPQRQGSGQGSRPVFSMIFGGSSSKDAPAASGATTGASSSVPPLPPPPGGWPPGAAPAAAAAAAMAAFAGSFGDAAGGAGGYPPPVGQGGDASSESGGGLGPADFLMGGSSGGTSAADFGSTAWLDYYDACLRAGGIRGGIAEFEEYARASGLQGTTTATSASSGGSGAGAMPQDRPVAGGADGGGDCPEGFEYDDGEGEDGRPTDRQLEELAAEEDAKRKKKAAKKRDKKARQKERAKREAETKAAQAAAKKREKAITSWRSRVVQACAAGDVRRMDVLVGESPYKNFVYDPSSMDDRPDDDEDRPTSHEDYLCRQLDWFLPNCIQKYQGGSSVPTPPQPFPDNPAREVLTRHVLATSYDVVLLQSPPAKVWNAVHGAAYQNDVDLLRWIARDGPRDAASRAAFLEGPCVDAGWTPLHYATAGGAEDAAEWLLAEGARVQAKTDRSLTCFNRYGRRGNGITARELAIVLQSGAVDDDLTSDAEILDEIVENRIENATATEKAAYMRVLRALEERLTYVTQHGYSPPKKKVIEVLRQDSVATSQSSGNGVSAGTAASSSSGKKSKKKKKKQQQQQQQAIAASNAPGPNPSEDASAPEPETKSSGGAPSSMSTDEDDEEDLSDPVAVALLGMGFSEDQIRSAARALGGFDHATADDMVMWILGGGEVADGGNSERIGGNTPAGEDNTTTINDDARRADAEVLSKVHKGAAARAKREAEESARRQREELAAAKRAAAKREEQRRIRREWNEREQARQAEERLKRVAEATERRKRAEMERLMPKAGVLPAAASAMPPPAIHVPGGSGGGGSGKHQHHPGHHGGGGPPLTIIAGGPTKSSNTKSKAGSNMGIPKAPPVRAPKILARPSNAPPGTLPGGAATGASSVQHQQPSSSSAGSQPLFALSSTAPVPAISSSAKHVSSSPRATAKPYNPSVHQHRHPPQSHPKPTAILQKNSSNPPGGPLGHGGGGAGSRKVHHVQRGGTTTAASSEYHHHSGQYAPEFSAYKGHGTSVPNNGLYKQDEVPSSSSMGSGSTPLFHNRSGHPVGGGGGGSSSVPPPGFRPGSAPESSANNEPKASTGASYVESNIMGTIRATAREFVPTSFKPQPAAPAPPPTPQKKSSNAVPSMSAQSATISSPPTPTRSTSNERSAELLLEPMSSLLSSFGAESNTPPATHVGPMVGNNKEQESTVPSAASSITGLSGLQASVTEDHVQSSRVGSIMTFESTPHATAGGGGGLQTSSILESLSYNGAGVEQIATGAAPLGGTGGPTAVGSSAGIWGGANNVNQGSTSLGLAGLNFTSFMSGGGDASNENGNDGKSNVGGGAAWGSSTGGSGSIW